MKVRDSFRRFRALEPDLWNWTAARVPEPLTDEVLEKKKEKEREKKKRARERKKEEKQEAAVAMEEARAKAIADAAAAAAAAAAAEAAALAGNACNSCGAAIKKGAAFFRLDFKYCSAPCVQAHRRSLMSEAAERRLTS